MKTIKFVILCIFFYLCSAAAVFAQSYAEEGIRIGEDEFTDVIGHQLGPVNVKAKVDTDMQYDSNIFWTPNDKKADLYNVTSPYVLVNMPLGIDQRHLLQLMYNADIGTFSDYKSQNYINQYAAFNGDFKLPFGYIDVQDDFDYTSDRATTEFTSRIPRYDNIASTVVGVKFNKLSMETGYSDNIRDYVSDLYSQYSHTEDMVSETALYQILPKTKALIEYDHGWITYYKDSDRNGDYDQVRVGLKGDITGKTQALIKVGFQDRTYDNINGFSGFVASAGTITQFSERTKLSLNYDQSAQESVYENNNYYDMHYFYATLNQKLMSHLELILNSGISRNIYPEVDPTLFQKRMDSILVEGISLRYNIKQWAVAKLGYTFREDMSNIKAEAYNDHLWTVGLEFQY
jgi:hypothetical protein